ncbi:hypothetical protein RJ640_021223 [Escallonia rubra]|uniref:Small-subunit processome Utp12 domain-containing protein n=1 Tax=Escallonia rubra TaxID=112253 RepID=A0AA88QT40_9ASTE|nr:hypothetical protein RJ640_021223 [Escallonia rubra]
MAKEKLKSLITSFTSDGDYLAVLSPDGTVKIWKTSSGGLSAEWKYSDGDIDARFSCVACSFIQKKRRNEQGTCLVALGTDDGNILAIDVFAGQTKWQSSALHPGGIAGIYFANKGRRLHMIGTNGMVYELNPETGELVKEFRISKKSISSSALSCDEKILAAASAKLQLFSLENGKEVLKFSADSGPVQFLSVSDDAKLIVTSGFGEKHLQVWKCNLSSGAVSSGPLLTMRHPPLAIECKNSCTGEDGLVVLSVSESGVAYVWNLKTISEEDINPTKITVQRGKAKDPLSSGRAKKSRTPIIAARLHALETDGQVTILVTYGPVDSPHFTFVDVSSPGEDIVIAAADETVKGDATIQESGVRAGIGGAHFWSLACRKKWKSNKILEHEELETDLGDMELEAIGGAVQKQKANKKRPAPDPESAKSETLGDEGIGGATDGVQIDNDSNELTMGEKLESLNLVDKRESSSLAKPPSADSVHVLLKQALHADDRVLLLDCLYRQDEKVITNSVSLLNPSDVLKLLESLVSIIDSRGAVLACAVPWLRSLLLQHASGIMSQESSLLALNSLYQLIESRVATFTPALQLSSCLDLLYAGTVDDGEEENGLIQPVVFEDKDESDEEGSEDAMETDDDSKNPEAISDISDVEGSDGMSE